VLAAHPAFALLWCSRVLSNVAFNMLGVAVGWQLYDLTGSALDLGLVGLAQFAPIVLLTLIVGQVADRYDRRLIASICQFAQAAAAALVAGTVSGRLASAGIFATVALVGGARAFEGPTSTALVSDVVPRSLISRAMPGRCRRRRRQASSGRRSAASSTRSARGRPTPPPRRCS
jgi:MFS family permease